jgi:catechol 2,3-dioxygenase-like lactoylglutathione lyase family enzyme
MCAPRRFIPGRWRRSATASSSKSHRSQTGHDPAAGFGANGKPDFWIGGEGGLNKPLHVAIHAKDRATVDAFYTAAMAAGGRDNGAPGIRAHYHPDYYGAFVLDPDGHNIEAVCHAPQ